jgi:hypothetical protein
MATLCFQKLLSPQTQSKALQNRQSRQSQHPKPTKLPIPRPISPYITYIPKRTPKTANRDWTQPEYPVTPGKTPYCLFSLSLKLDEINFNQERGSVWIMFIYLFGLVCLAYMVNFVLQK